MDDKDSPIYHANYNERFDALMHHIIVNLGGLREELFAKIYNKDTKPDFIRTFTHKVQTNIVITNLMNFSVI